MRSRLIMLIGFWLSLLSSCTCSPQAQKLTSSDAKPLRLFIWGDYTSKEVLTAFEQKFQTQVIETNFASNEEALAKLQAGADGYDVIVPSDYMVTIMIKLGLLEPLDTAQIPNHQLVDPELLTKEFDPKNVYSMPYSWSATGIAMTAKKIKPAIEGYKDLLTRPDLKGKVAMLDDMREVLGAALRIQGDSLNSQDEAKIQQAGAFLKTAKPQIKEFNSSPAQSLLQGDIVAAQMYSNEALRARLKNPEIQFILPKEGATIAIDNMVVLKSSQNKKLAHAFINFMLDTEINKQFATALWTAPVNSQSAAQLPDTRKQLQVIGKPADLAKRAEPIKDVGDATTIYDRLWTEFKAQ